jgi:hypothetical protein
MKKFWEIVLELLKKLLPAAQKDPVAASLGVLALLAEAVTLSEWQFQWTTSFTIWDFVPPLFSMLFIWRLYRRSWAGASLALAVVIILVVMLIFFAYSVPFKRLSITLADAVIIGFLVGFEVVQGADSLSFIHVGKLLSTAQRQ